MSYRDIFVYVDDQKGGEARTAFAAKLAQRSSAALVGGVMTADFVDTLMVGDPFCYLTPGEYESFAKIHGEAVRSAVERAKAVFGKATDIGGLTSEWTQVDGDDAATLAPTMRWFDLAIVPRELMVLGGFRRVQAAEIILACGGPVVVTPPDDGPLTSDRIVVAWKNSREAARALRDALPLLKAAKEVLVVSVAREPDDTLASMLHRRLERHGIAAQVAIERGRAADEALLRISKEFRADMLVMGAYGHSRAQETLLGGVTHRLLKEATIPLLLSH